MKPIRVFEPVRKAATNSVNGSPISILAFPLTGTVPEGQSPAIYPYVDMVLYSVIMSAGVVGTGDTTIKAYSTDGEQICDDFILPQDSKLQTVDIFWALEFDKGVYIDVTTSGLHKHVNIQFFGRRATGGGGG